MNLNENALDPIQKTRCQDIFIAPDKDIVKEKVKYFILDTFLKWFKKMGYGKEKIKTMYLIGSSLGYQYTDTTDIDVHIEVDFSQEKADELGKLLPNGNILPDTKHPIQFYLTTNLKDVKNSDNAYDLIKDKWLQKSDKDNIQVPVSQILEISKFFMAGIEDRLAEYKRDKKELEIYKSYSTEKQEITQKELDDLINNKENEIKADLDALFVGYHVIRGLRKEVFVNGENNIDSPDLEYLIDIQTKKPNYSISNLIYKTLERFGYLETLHDVMEERKKLLDNNEKK